MEDKNNWAKLNDDLNDLTNKLQDKIAEDESIDDLRQSFKDTLNNMSSVIKNISNVIESTVSKDEIKSDSKKLINNIYEEFETSIKHSMEKFTKNIKLNTFEEEE